MLSELAVFAVVAWLHQALDISSSEYDREYIGAKNVPGSKIIHDFSQPGSKLNALWSNCNKLFQSQ